MGVFRFFSQFILNNHRDVLTKSLKQSKDAYNYGLIIDFNSVLHNVAQRVFSYGNKKDVNFLQRTKNEELYKTKTLDQIITEFYLPELIKTTDTIISNAKLNSSGYVIIAVDGTVPNAKILQQRTRRLGESSSDYISALAGFSSDQITPFTNFMEIVHLRLNEYYKARTDKSKRERSENWKARNAKKYDEVIGHTLPKVFLYSSYKSAGEGEHKAMSRVKELLKTGTIKNDNKTRHIIYGSDADLIMLALASPLKNVHIARGEDGGSLGSIIDINRLYGHIKTLMTVDPTTGEKSSSAGFDDDVLKNDFVILTMWLGNDFLPRQPSTIKLDYNIFEAYRNINSPLTCKGIGFDHDIDDLYDKRPSEIILFSMGNFIYQMSKVEEKMIFDTITDPKITFIEDFKAVDDSFADDVLDFELFRDRWNFYTAESKETIENKDIHHENELSPKITNIVQCYEYLKGISWMYRYYTSGQEYVSWNYQYNFNRAPLFHNLYEYLSSCDKHETIIILPDSEEVHHVPIMSDKRVLDNILLTNIRDFIIENREENDYSIFELVDMHWEAYINKSLKETGVTERDGDFNFRGGPGLLPYQHILAVLKPKSLSFKLGKKTNINIKLVNFLFDNEDAPLSDFIQVIEIGRASCRERV